MNTEYYSESDAREKLIESGHKLLEEKLVARTWGNISARISDNQFVITPSGRAYENLKPEETVKVQIDDLSYSGDIKPSSEKGIHAIIYKYRPEIKYIIHTHQFYASAVAAAGEDIDIAPCSEYGSAGSDLLKKNIEKCLLANQACHSILMSKHGVLCFGASEEEAFAYAHELEEFCRKIFFEKKKEKVSPARYKMAWSDDYAQLIGFGKNEDEDPEVIMIITEKNSAAAEYAYNAKPISFINRTKLRYKYLKKYSKLKNKKS